MPGVITCVPSTLHPLALPTMLRLLLCDVRAWLAIRRILHLPRCPSAPVGCETLRWTKECSSFCRRWSCRRVTWCSRAPCFYGSKTSYLFCSSAQMRAMAQRKNWKCFCLSLHFCMSVSAQEKDPYRRKNSDFLLLQFVVAYSWTVCHVAVRQELTTNWLFKVINYICSNDLDFWRCKQFLRTTLEHKSTYTTQTNAPVRGSTCHFWLVCKFCSDPLIVYESSWMVMCYSVITVIC